MVVITQLAPLQKKRRVPSRVPKPPPPPLLSGDGVVVETEAICVGRVFPEGTPFRAEGTKKNKKKKTKKKKTKKKKEEKKKRSPYGSIIAEDDQEEEPRLVEKKKKKTSKDPITHAHRKRERERERERKREEFGMLRSIPLRRLDRFGRPDGRHGVAAAAPLSAAAAAAAAAVAVRSGRRSGPLRAAGLRRRRRRPAPGGRRRGRQLGRPAPGDARRLLRTDLRRPLRTVVCFVGFSFYRPLFLWPASKPKVTVVRAGQRERTGVVPDGDAQLFQHSLPARLSSDRALLLGRRRPRPGRRLVQVRSSSAEKERVAQRRQQPEIGSPRMR